MPNPAQLINTKSPWKIGSERIAGEELLEADAPSVPEAFVEDFEVVGLPEGAIGASDKEVGTLAIVALAP